MDNPLLSLVRSYFSFIWLTRLGSFSFPTKNGDGSTPARGNLVIECHVPNFALGHNGLITFSIFMRVSRIDAKGQIIAKEENY